MPKQSALRQFKAALFETLSDPIRIKLLRRLSQSKIEVGDLLQCLDPAERANAARHLAVLEGNRIIGRHEAGTEIYYSLDDALLQEALGTISENSAWSVALADPIRIEILEFLCEGSLEQKVLIRKIEHAERLHTLDQLGILVNTNLICRRTDNEHVFYQIKQNGVRDVLLLLRSYFEDNLLAALTMISQRSYAHIRQETAHLKSRLESASDVSRKSKAT